MKTAIKTDVIIVGAGPTGLSLAAQLIRYGISFVIFDKKEDITDLSKALIVHARTLEIYEQIDLAQKAIVEGTVLQKGILMNDGEISARLDFSDIGSQLSAFPFFLILEQSKGDLQQELNTEYGEWLDCHFLTLSSRVKEIFGSDRPFMVLLRPDNYIGFLSADLYLEDLQSYFTSNKLFRYDRVFPVQVHETS